MKIRPKRTAKTVSLRQHELLNDTIKCLELFTKYLEKAVRLKEAKRKLLRIFYTRLYVYNFINNNFNNKNSIHFLLTYFNTQLHTLGISKNKK